MLYSWEKDAKSGKPIPSGLCLTDQKAYMALQLLTARYKAGLVGVEQAQRERKEIDRAFVSDSGADAANAWVVGLRKRIEIAHAQYRKERTIEAADRLSDVIDGFLREIDYDG